MTDFFSHTRVRPVAEEGCVCGGGTGGGGGLTDALGVSG